MVFPTLQRIVVVYILYSYCRFVGIGIEASSSSLLWLIARFRFDRPPNLQDGSQMRRYCSYQRIEVKMMIGPPSLK